ncbi:hypothetical protein EDB85DRAFT_1926822, partial [Lactarius pseudohatsudake]
MDDCMKHRMNDANQPHRLYLRWGELLPNPRIGKGCVWESQEDRALITTMGFDVATSRLLLKGGGLGNVRRPGPHPSHERMSVHFVPRL